MAVGWRHMAVADLPQVGAIADAVHRDFPEPPEVFANRLALFPAGCLVCASENRVVGYLLSHPWVSENPPELGAILPSLPAQPDCLYLHDIALLPDARAGGHGAAAFEHCLALARAEKLACIELVAVGGAESYWRKQGFGTVANRKAEAYGEGSCLMRYRVAG